MLDRERDVLVLATDVFGTKPLWLVVSEHQGRWVIAAASSARAARAEGRCPGGGVACVVQSALG